MRVEERFLRYVKVETTSDDSSSTVPSTASQLELAKILEEELRTIGLEGVRLDDKGYVYGYLPATAGCEGIAPMGLIAHMDTAPAYTAANVKPRIVKYQGGDISLGNGAVISCKRFPFMPKYEGHDLIVTDGSTLLGADDKAGVAEIITTMEYLTAHPEIKHGKISVAFTPDEEIGRGADHFDMENFHADYAYTVDGGAVGGIEYECFNAAGATITIKGVNIHPGSAKNKMKNALLIANSFISMLPPWETPAHTEGYEGFFHLEEMAGNESSAHLKLIIRDHDRELFEKRKKTIEGIVSYLNGVYGEETLTADISDTYYNMKEKILPVIEIVEKAKVAFEAEGIEPVVTPIRGGTDGAALSEKGLPCPNLSTGGENFHGVHEFISIQSMEKMVKVLTELVRA